MRSMSRLEKLNLDIKLSREETASRFTEGQKRLLQLRLISAGMMPPSILGPPICVVMEGWDASGKGGCIKRLVSGLDPRHVRVHQFSAPTPSEKRHHFLTRFWPSLPGWGGMAVLDRSWYGRVLVERVERFASHDEWRRSYQQIRWFEKMLSEEGTVFVKIWLHISHKEQGKRFRDRETNPLKQWKLTPEDHRNRAKRPEYLEALEDMFLHTDQPCAPWRIIPANSKNYARIAVIETVNHHIEEGLRAQGIEPPPLLDQT